MTCRVLKIARQPYYRLKKPVTDAELAEAYRANALFDAHREDPEFGYRYLADEAEAAGEKMCRRTAWRICSSGGWASAISRKRRRRHRKAGEPVHDDLVERDFTAYGRNELRLTGIPPQAGGAPSEHRTGQGKLYLVCDELADHRLRGSSTPAKKIGPCA